jgi:hypothetical protein
VKTNPSTSWLKVQNSYHWAQNSKQIQCDVCFAKDKPQKDLNEQSAEWSFVLTQIRFKSQICNMKVCSDPSFRAFHTKSQFSDQHLTEKSTLHNCMYHFSLHTDIF